MLNKTSVAIAASTLAFYSNAVQMEDSMAVETALAQTEWGWISNIINTVTEAVAPPKPKPKPQTKPFIATNSWTTKANYEQRGGEAKNVKLHHGAKYNFEPVGEVHSAWFATNKDNPTAGYNCMDNVT